MWGPEGSFGCTRSPAFGMSGGVHGFQITMSAGAGCNVPHDGMLGFVLSNSGYNDRNWQSLLSQLSTISSWESPPGVQIRLEGESLYLRSV